MKWPIMARPWQIELQGYLQIGLILGFMNKLNLQILLLGKIKILNNDTEK